jgi:hypothetical protein
MTTQIEITQRNHRRALTFFWCFLIGATMVSLVGNIAHAMLPYIPRIDIQIGAALSSPPCTASPSPSVRERPAGFTAGPWQLSQRLE